MSYRTRLAPRPQRKLLAIDGGGIRGILALEILKKVEAELRVKSGNTRLVLSDYFDFIGGTSTGAIVAAGLAKGMTVDEIIKFYVDNGAAMFTKAGLLSRLHYKFDDEPLAKELRNALGRDARGNYATFGSDILKSMLLVVLRNATTDSPWPLCNNPNAKYNDPASAECNLNLPLWQLIRASTAAPTYFPPEVISLGPKQKQFIFVDGGVTMYNNPAFQMFLMATVDRYWVRGGEVPWPTGEDKMLIVSIGTGTSPGADASLDADEMHLLFNATSIPSALMFAALNEQDFLCRVFGKCLSGDPIDREVGDMIGSKGPLQQKMFTYVRYNAELSKEGLATIGCADVRPEVVQQLDSIAGIGDLRRVGEAVGALSVKPGHFAYFS